MILDQPNLISAIAVTPAGTQCLLPLLETGLTLWSKVDDHNSAATLPTGVQAYPGSLRDHLTALWPTQRGLVFCLATGAVVRLIAPLLQDKATDPAIVVVDEAGQTVISLCGGHQGGADDLARWVAAQLQAQVILTGASNAQAYPAVDTLGQPFGWNKGEGNWTGLSAIAARGEAIEVIQEAGSTLWQANLPTEHPYQIQADPADDSPQTVLPKPTGRLWITPHQRRFDPEATFAKAQWHPRVLWVGLGCERGTSAALIEQAIAQTCRQNHLAEAAIAGVASLDLKADEPGLLELCTRRGWPLVTFTAAQLAPIPTPNPSDIVAQAVGTPSVAEAAAIAIASQPTLPSLPNQANPPVIPWADHPLTSPQPYRLRVEKQVYRQDDQPGAVTVAIAQAEQEWLGRSGQLLLVGIGPGAVNQITPAAQAALTQADVIVGYGLYIDLVRSRLRPGQILEARPITAERERAERAVELAQQGFTVAVISSGDSGIYGMAGLVMEWLQTQGWDGRSPRVQVFPGITALQAAAARVGTPLMHDFCAISLSDLLTPWPVIEQRLTAAAAADFVMALYNPQSQTRTKPLAAAHQILLAHRPPDTPVALVRNAYREGEQITITTIADMMTQAIDMLTVVLIGNRSTQRYQNWLITPRGYLGNL